MQQADSRYPGEDEAWRERLAVFAGRVGLGPGEYEILRRALTHRSLSDVVEADNERLEFLGDSILALLVNEFLYRAYPRHSEGQLTRLKQRYVCEAALVETARAIGINELLLMAPNDLAAGGRERPSSLGNAVEAVLAAVYLSRGLEAAREFVRRELISLIDPAQVWDYKSRLQELYQERHRVTPAYHSATTEGPAHEPLFHSEVRAGDTLLGAGSGRNKKLAEQAAAQDALARLEKAPGRRRGARG